MIILFYTDGFFVIHFLDESMADLNGLCPICDASVLLNSDLEVSEVVTCSDCNSQLVVDEKKAGGSVILKEAPQVEEDWGE